MRQEERKEKRKERKRRKGKEKGRVRLRETESKRERERERESKRDRGGVTNKNAINIYFENIFKAGLHYCDYLPKLVPFEEQKNIFYILKRP